MRRILSILLITLACVIAPLSLVVIWGKAEVTNTDQYVSTVAPLASNPEVQNAVIARVTAYIDQKADAQTLAKDAVDQVAANRGLSSTQEQKLQKLVDQLAKGIQGVIDQKVADVVRSQQFADIWTKANTDAHQQVEAFLSGDTNPGVTVANDEVTLNLGPIVEQVKSDLVADGYQVASKIPSTGATFVLVQSNQIGKAQKAYSALNTLGWVIPIAAVILGLLGVVVARRRSAALMGLGVGLVASCIATALGLWIGRQIYLDHLPTGSDAQAATAVFDTLLSRFKGGVIAIGALGLILAAIAWYWRGRPGKGPGEPATMDDLLNDRPAPAGPAGPAAPAPGQTAIAPAAEPSDNQSIEDLLRETDALTTQRINQPPSGDTPPDRTS